MSLPKAIAIVGPTACGKTKLAVYLADKFNGEIISADSRQIYKYLDICTGKDKKDYLLNKDGKNKQIPCHLIDFLDLKKEFSSADFQSRAFSEIESVLKKKKLPFLTGGSPFYAYSVTEGWQFPKIEKDLKIRKRLRSMDLSELQETLKKIDPKAYQNIDQKNPRRLERAIEVCLISGKKFEDSKPKSKPRYDFLFLGKIFDLAVIKERISKRLKERFKEGMIEEVEAVLKNNWGGLNDLERMGLEPRFISYYLQKKISKKELEELLLKNILSFAKRQINWFKKDRRIHWIENRLTANKLVKEFLES